MENTPDTKAPKGGLFTQLYTATKEQLKGLEKPIKERQLKRKFQSAWDDAESRKIEAEERINKARKNFDHFDINDILHAKDSIKRCSELQASIEAEYNDYFGEAMF